MQLPRPGPSPTPAKPDDAQPDPSTGAYSHSEGAHDAPPQDGTGQEVDAEPYEDAQPHDTRRRRLRLRLSVATQEAIRSFAESQGISEAGLLDALLHGLEGADPGWLDGVIEQARTMDAYYRSEDGRTNTSDAPPP